MFKLVGQNQPLSPLLLSEIPNCFFFIYNIRMYKNCSISVDTLQQKLKKNPINISGGPIWDNIPVVTQLKFPIFAMKFRILVFAKNLSNLSCKFKIILELEESGSTWKLKKNLQHKFSFMNN